MRGTKDIPEILQSQDYARNMEEAMGWKVILTDTKTQQHCLADGASTVLHLCRAWLSGKYSRLAPQGVAEKIWSPSTPAGPLVSFETLMSVENRALQLYTSSLKRESKAPVPGEHSDGASSESSLEHPPVTKEWYLFQHQAQFFYHWLEQIRDRMVLARKSPNVDLALKGTKAIGFQFRDLLSSKSLLEPRTVEFSDGAKPWLRYARSVDAIYIHGSELGDLVRLTTGQVQQFGRCTVNANMPCGKDYLVAPLSVLREGTEQFEHTRTCAQLAEGLYWTNIEKCFSACHCQSPKPRRRCQRVITQFCSDEPSKSADDFVDGLPEVFNKFPTAVVLIGGETASFTEQVSRVMPTIGRKRKDESRNQEPEILEPDSQERTISDSGYGSHSVRDGSLTSSVEAGPSSDRGGNLTAVGAPNDDDGNESPVKRRRVDGG